MAGFVLLMNWLLLYWLYTFDSIVLMCRATDHDLNSSLWAFNLTKSFHTYWQVFGKVTWQQRQFPHWRRIGFTLVQPEDGQHSLATPWSHLWRCCQPPTDSAGNPNDPKSRESVRRSPHPKLWRRSSFWFNSDPPTADRRRRSESLLRPVSLNRRILSGKRSFSLGTWRDASWRGVTLVAGGHHFIVLKGRMRAISCQTEERSLSGTCIAQLRRWSTEPRRGEEGILVDRGRRVRARARARVCVLVNVAVRGPEYAFNRQSEDISWKWGHFGPVLTFPRNFIVDIFRAKARV